MSGLDRARWPGIGCRFGIVSARAGRPGSSDEPKPDEPKGVIVIFITAKFRVRPEDADRWPEIAGDFTRATRSEPGCLWFDWSRSLDDQSEYVLIEAFRDDEAGVAHVQSDHFKAARQALPPHLQRTPQIVNAKVAQDGWSDLGEMAVPGGD